VHEFGSTSACEVADVQGWTTREGIRLGAMAGTVDIVQRAYMGLAARDDCLWFDPGLPDEVISLDTELHYEITASGLRYGPTFFA
jgi:trehalose/maltose hydrolase-like predicted phosphorylase